jgi:hypothetical protein
MKGMRMNNVNRDPIRAWLRKTRHVDLTPPPSYAPKAASPPPPSPVEQAVADLHQILRAKGLMK